MSRITLLGVVFCVLAGNGIAAILKNQGPMNNSAAVWSDRVRRHLDGYRYGFSNDEIKTIVQTHLDRRSGVMPSAANMKYMSWDDGLAETAQKLAWKCIFEHDTNADRATEDFPHVGQNVWASTKFGDHELAGAVDDWFNEESDYDFNTGSCSGRACGHYTQGAWANSFKVGCGMAECEKLTNLYNMHSYVVVCNYGPAGNYMGQSPYMAGAPCSNCPYGFGGDCYLDQCLPDELCGGLMCSNGGTMNFNTCVCDCTWGYIGSLCTQTMDEFEDRYSSWNEENGARNVLGSAVTLGMGVVFRWMI